jgi:hypothetical protein
MILNQNTWQLTNRKPLRHPNNKEFVTARANIINKKKVIRISIGIDICDLVGFKKNDRVHIYLNKYERDSLLICNNAESIDGYRLHYKGDNNNFMTFDFRIETEQSFRLSQTIILPYDIQDEGKLLISLEKLKWRK